MEDMEIRLLRLLAREGSVRVMEFAGTFDTIIHKDNPYWRDQVESIMRRFGDHYAEEVKGVFFIYPE